MRHATTVDLEHLADVLTSLRRMDGLVEKTPGAFYRRSRAFCHFHADGDERFVDVRWDHDFTRLRVTTVRERRTFVTAVRRALAAS